MSTLAILGLIGAAITAMLIHFRGSISGKRKQRLSDAKDRLKDGTVRLQQQEVKVGVASEAHKQSLENEQAVKDAHDIQNAETLPGDARASSVTGDEELEK